MILLIDNYDSFTYNLKQSIEVSSLAGKAFECIVKRNNQISLDEIEKLQPSHLVLSPGPGNPDSAGITLEVIKKFAGKIPILGVCLGHQSIGQAFGGKVIHAPTPQHGKVSAIHHTQQGIFKNIKNPLQVARYHSLVVEEKSLPACLEVTARTDDGVIMGLRHRNYTQKYAIEGVQFHPESIATEDGLVIIKNFLAKESA